MSLRPSRIFVSLLLILLLTACSSAPTVQPTATAEATPAAETEPEQAEAQPTEAAPTEPVATEEPAEPTEAAPSATPQPSPQPTTPAQELTVLLSDDFSDETSGWEHYNEGDGVLDYADGGYRMYVNAINTYWVSANVDAVSDVVVEVDAVQQAGPQAGHYGIMCRLDTSDYSYYAFLVTGDGRAAIVHVAQNQLEFLGGDGFVEVDGLGDGDQVRHLRASCLGETLTLEVDGAQVLQVGGAASVAGDVGLVAGSSDEPGTDVLFDDIVVSVPQ